MTHLKLSRSTRLEGNILTLLLPYYIYYCYTTIFLAHNLLEEERQ